MVEPPNMPRYEAISTFKMILHALSIGDYRVISKLSGVADAADVFGQVMFDWEPESVVSSVAAGAARHVLQGERNLVFKTVEVTNQMAEAEATAGANTTAGESQSNKKAKKRGSQHTVVGYARVLQGLDNCHFCAMLASRGPVYSHDAVLDGMGNPRVFHNHCDCKVVLVVEGTDWEGKKEYEQLEQAWLDAEQNLTDWEKDNKAPRRGVSTTADNFARRWTQARKNYRLTGQNPFEYMKTYFSDTQGTLNPACAVDGYKPKTPLVHFSDDTITKVLNAWRDMSTGRKATHVVNPDGGLVEIPALNDMVNYAAHGAVNMDTVNAVLHILDHPNKVTVQKISDSMIKTRVGETIRLKRVLHGTYMGKKHTIVWYEEGVLNSDGTLDEPNFIVDINDKE